MAMAIAHMANNDSKLIKAFRYHEVIDKITSKGWGNFIIWYIVTVVLFFVLYIIASIPIIIIILVIFHSIVGTNPRILQDILLTLLVFPYFYMFLGRSVGLFYISEEK